MALLVTIDDPRGFVMQDAYCRVEAVEIPDKTNMRFQLRCYKDSSYTTAFSDKSFACDYVIDEANPYEQAYMHLKSLQKFSEAVDV